MLQNGTSSEVLGTWAGAAGGHRIRKQYLHLKVRDLPTPSANARFHTRPLHSSRRNEERFTSATRVSQAVKVRRFLAFS
jgi:hypothetical protein